MILVTGGAGFIGKHLVKRLYQEGFHVRVLDNLSSGTPEGLEFAELVKKDIRDKDISGVFNDVDVVFHLAADPDVRGSVSDPVRNFDINVIGSLNVLEAARKAGVEKFIFASSGGTVYGDTPEYVDETAPFRPISPYGASKAAFETYLSAYASSYGMTCASLRMANVLGPGLTHGVIWDFFWKLKKDPNRLEVLGDGTQNKSYIHVEDVVSAFMKVMEYAKGYDPYNVALKETLTVKQIVEIVTEALSVNPRVLFTGGKRGWVGDVNVMKLDCKKLKSIGWSARYSATDSIKDTLRWLNSKYC